MPVPEGSKWPEHFQPAVVRTGFGGGRLSSYCLALEAWRRGLDVKILGPQATDLRITDSEKTVRFNHSRSGNPRSDFYALVLDKHRTAQVLRSAGVPVPDSHLLDISEVDFPDVLDVARSVGFPVVLKPLRGTMGKGVFANINKASELEDSFQTLKDSLKDPLIVLERHHYGEDFRIYVVGERYVAACKRIPANVIGDGQATINQLISRKNAYRRRNPFLAGGLIVKDHEVRSMIARAGYTLQTVPSEGEHVVLRQKANASAGGDVIDVTQDLPEGIRQAAVNAVREVPGLPAAGVDILWEDTKDPDGKSEFVIVEMNSRPHIGVNMYPTHGVGQDVPKEIIDVHFPHTPRRTQTNLASLTFDRQDIERVIASGVVSETTLKPIPDHGYPVRRRYSLAPDLELSQSARNSLAKVARKLDVIGTINLSGNRPRVIIGTRNAQRADHFMRELAERLRDEPQRLRGWRGALYSGFSIS